MPKFTVEESIKKIETLGKILRHEAEIQNPMTKNEMTAVRAVIQEQITHKENVEHKQRTLPKKVKKHRL